MWPLSASAVVDSYSPVDTVGMASSVQLSVSERRAISMFRLHNGCWQMTYSASSKKLKPTCEKNHLGKCQFSAFPAIEIISHMTHSLHTFILYGESESSKYSPLRYTNVSPSYRDVLMVQNCAIT